MCTINKCALCRINIGASIFLCYFGVRPSHVTMLRPGMPKAFASYIQCGCVYDIFVHIFTKYMWIRKKPINQSQVGTGRFGHSTSSAIVVSAIVPVRPHFILFMLFYVFFITILCINNHIEYKKK